MGGAGGDFLSVSGRSIGTGFTKRFPLWWVLHKTPEKLLKHRRPRGCAGSAAGAGCGPSARSVLLTRRPWKPRRKSPLMVTVASVFELVAGKGLRSGSSRGGKPTQRLCGGTSGAGCHHEPSVRGRGN